MLKEITHEVKKKKRKQRDGAICVIDFYKKKSKRNIDKKRTKEVAASARGLAVGVHAGISTPRQPLGSLSA